MTTTVVSAVVGVSLTANDQSAKFAVGTVINTSDGGFATYVSATSDISQYAAVVLDDKGGAKPLTTTNSAVSKRIAFAQTSIASSYFGWVQGAGQVIVNLAVNCAPSVPLYTTGTAGVLDDAVVSTGLCLGIVATSSISNATAVTCVAARGVMIGSGDMD